MTASLNTTGTNQAGRRRFHLGALRALALAAVIALFGNACATVTTSGSYDNGEPKWSSKDRTLAAALIASHIVDIGQTQAALKSGLAEGNPIYGSHPSLGRMIATKAAATGLVLWAADRYPALRSKLLATNLAIQVAVVGLNARYVGLKVSF